MKQLVQKAGYPPRHVLRLLTISAIAALTFLTFFSQPATANAASETVAATCTPSADLGCLTGTLSDVGAGVELTISGPAGEIAAVTDETGRWTAEVSEAGEYVIAIVATTLPDGVTLRSNEPQTRPVTLHASTAVLFSLDTSGAATNTSTPEPGASTAPATGETTVTGFNWDRFAQQAASGLRLGLLLALAAVGLSLVYGTTGISNLAHGELVTFGGLIGFVFANVLGLNLILSGILVIAAGAALGYIQSVALWQPLRQRGLGVTQLMIVTIGLSIAMQYAFQFFIGAGTVRIDRSNPETFSIGPVTLTIQSYIAMGVAVLVLIGVGIALLKTRLGRATRAVSDNPALAAASGIDVNKIIRLVWVVATALAALAGLMLGLVLNGVNWMTGMQLLLLLFSAVTLGGLGTAFGALVGALVVGMTVELTNIWLPGDFKYATALVLLIILLLVRPQGIFGRKDRIG